MCVGGGRWPWMRDKVETLLGGWRRGRKTVRGSTFYSLPPQLTSMIGATKTDSAGE